MSGLHPEERIVELQRRWGHLRGSTCSGDRYDKIHADLLAFYDDARDDGIERAAKELEILGAGADMAAPLFRPGAGRLPDSVDELDKQRAEQAAVRLFGLKLPVFAKALRALKKKP